MSLGDTAVRQARQQEISFVTWSRSKFNTSRITEIANLELALSVFQEASISVLGRACGQSANQRVVNKKKNLVYKNQGWEPIHQKYKANESTSRHNPKKKKTNNQQK
jgi:hypothetical protein